MKYLGTALGVLLILAVSGFSLYLMIDESFGTCCIEADGVITRKHISEDLVQAPTITIRPIRKIHFTEPNEYRFEPGSNVYNAVSVGQRIKIFYVVGKFSRMPIFQYRIAY